MSDVKDFIIENGVLTAYTGSDSDVVVPEGVTKIRRRAFSSNFAVRTITLPEGLVAIEKEAFDWCLNLEKIVFSSTVTELSSDIIKKCECLHTVEAPDSVIDGVWKALSARQRAAVCQHSLQSGAPLRSVEVKTIEKSNSFITAAIEQNDGAYLSRVLSLKKTLPLQVLDEYIALSRTSPATQAVLVAYKNARYSPTAIEEIEADANALALGMRQRTDAEWKEILTLKKSGDGWLLTSWRGDDVDLVLPDTVDGKPIVAIGQDAFTPLQKNTAAVKEARSRLRRVVLPVGVKVLGEDDRFSNVGVFRDCGDLEQVILPEALVEIGSYAWRGCPKLSTLHLPKNVKKIGCYALPSTLAAVTVDESNKTLAVAEGYLYDKKKNVIMATWGDTLHPKEDILALRVHACSGNECVTSVRLPDSITALEADAFSGCASLAEVTLPATLTKIPAGLFSGCKQLTRVTIPEGVTEIGLGAFAGCTRLKRVDIPATVTKIGGKAFMDAYGAKLLKSVTIHAPEGSYAEAYAQKNKIPFVAEK